jgi:hypothetical protein
MRILPSLLGHPVVEIADSRRFARLLGHDGHFAFGNFDIDGDASLFGGTQRTRKIAEFEGVGARGMVFSLFELFTGRAK